MIESRRNNKPAFVGLFACCFLIAGLVYTAVNPKNDSRYYSGHAPWDGFVPTVEVMHGGLLYKFLIPDELDKKLQPGVIYDFKQLTLFSICNARTKRECLRSSDGKMLLTHYTPKVYIAGDFLVDRVGAPNLSLDFDAQPVAKPDVVSSPIKFSFSARYEK